MKVKRKVKESEDEGESGGEIFAFFDYYRKKLRFEILVKDQAMKLSKRVYSKKILTSEFK